MSSRDAENYSVGDQSGLIKEPQEWKSGDDPATPSQLAYLETLSDQTGEDVPDGLTKAAASEKIDQLRAKAGLDDDRNAGANVGIGPDTTDEPESRARELDASDLDGSDDEAFRVPGVQSNTAR